MRRWPAIWTGLLALALPLKAGAEAPKPVMLDGATLRRLSVTTAPARMVTQAGSVAGFARVLDPIPLAQLDADIAAARPTAAASAAEAARSQALFAEDATVSRKVAQAAAMQAGGDNARLSLLVRRLGLEWGPAISRLSDARRGALVAALSSGRSALVRIDSANGVGQAGLHMVQLDLGEMGSATATILGPARAADPRLQSPGLIAQVSGPKAALLSTGLSVTAKLGGTAHASIFVPNAAILRVEGASWVYRRIGAQAFARTRLIAPVATAGGLLAGGLRAGDPIVTNGAAALYAAERGGGPAEG
ncbi:hypothetical protein HL653_16125 [Sphingomonas sp. AP4-R1]|uniref:hypothetical protein n=1 Tax=Sphingomonas sp. AP4-R1 TaxID=2735134 RepID=UPI001493494A|nr:hypothetical protein [Sphingomonas sp. AP4-R1]QJU59085.1 hypothetical protein HL653_16125 [Sphingomonas sp. AP4-R1]